MSKQTKGCVEAHMRRCSGMCSLEGWLRMTAHGLAIHFGMDQCAQSLNLMGSQPRSRSTARHPILQVAFGCCLQEMKAQT